MCACAGPGPAWPTDPVGSPTANLYVDITRTPSDPVIRSQLPTFRTGTPAVRPARKATGLLFETAGLPKKAAAGAFVGTYRAQGGAA